MQNIINTGFFDPSWGSSSNLAFIGKLWQDIKMEPRRSYSVSLVVNDRAISEVVVDGHFEVKHAESINDEIILKLVQKLNGRFFEADDQDDEFEYFKTEPIELDGKNYRLIWLLKNDCMFIGVVNAFRRP